MINLEVGDIIILSNGQTMRILKFNENFLFVDTSNWEVYLSLAYIDHIFDFSEETGIYIEDIIKSREVATVKTF
jgi:hypothetical protein